MPDDWSLGEVRNSVVRMASGDSFGKGEESPELAEAFGEHGERHDILRKYINEIQKMERLSPEQEKMLGRLVRSGNRAARERFITANLQLVVSIAKRYCWRCTAAVSLIDMIQEGNIGIMKAVERFDPEAGFRFSTYATYWVRNAIERYLTNHARTVRSPAHIQSMHWKYDDTVAVLREELERLPSTDEIAVAMGMKSSTIDSYLAATQDMLSLNDSFSGDDDMEFIDNIPDERFRPDTAFFVKDMERTLTDSMHDVVNHLPYPQCVIIKMRYGLDNEEILSLDSTALRLGISTDTVRKYEGRAQNILRKRLAFMKKYM